MKTASGECWGSIEGMPWLGTFHAICVKLLRRHAELVGLKSNFTILDTDDQLRLLKQLVGRRISTTNAGLPGCWPAIIDSWKNRAWTPDKLPAAEAGAYDGKGAEIYAHIRRA